MSEIVSIEVVEARLPVGSVVISRIGPTGNPGLFWVNEGWAVDFEFTKNNAVAHNGSSYRCVSAHVASSDNEPGFGAIWEDVWELIAQKGDPGVNPVGALLNQNSLSDLSNKQEARTNLDVYSKSEVDNAISAVPRYTDADADARIAVASLLRPENNLYDLTDVVAARGALSVYSKTEVDAALAAMEADFNSAMNALNSDYSAFKTETQSALDVLNNTVSVHDTAILGLQNALDGLTADAVAETALKKWWNADLTRATDLTGLSAATGGTLSATDTILSALGKLENRVALNDLKVTGADRLKLDGSNAMTGGIAFTGLTKSGNTKVITSGDWAITNPSNHIGFSGQDNTENCVLFKTRGSERGVLIASNAGMLGFAASGVLDLASADVRLFRGGPNILELRNLNNSQEFRIYNTFTDILNHARAFMRFTSGDFYIGTEAAGTGVSGNLRVTTGTKNVVIEANRLVFIQSGGGESARFSNNGLWLGPAANNPVCRLDMADAWNNAANTFTAVRLNVTDTASAAASLLMDLQVGGVSVFNVRKNGFIYPNAVRAGTIGINEATNVIDFYSSTGLIGFYDGFGTRDVVIRRDAAGVLALRNAANPQEFRIYNTFTDAANYERAVVQWNANSLVVGTAHAGTGSARSLFFQTGNSIRWAVTSGGTFWPNSNNSIDFGDPTHCIRSGYFGTSVVTPKLNFSATLTPTGSADATGATGDVRYDDNFVYVKASTGWKRAALNTF